MHFRRAMRLGACEPDTSKANTLDSLGEVRTFGFRGEALASAADISCLEISSRTAISRRTWSVITKNGKCLYNGPAARWRMERPGTVVHLRDIFHNLPIRRNSHPRPSRTLEIICRDLETLALVFPGVSFTISTIRQSSEMGPHTDRLLHIPKTSSILSAFRHIHGKHFADEVDEVSVSSGATELEGFIGLRGSRRKAHQYIYINRHLLSPSHHLHRNIDHAFSNSSFSKRVSCVDATDHARQHTRHSPHKLDQKPIYVLSLTVPPRDIDNCLEPGKSSIHISNEDAITTFVDSVIHAFLLRHGFLFHSEVRPTPQKRRKVATGEEDSSGDKSETRASQQTACESRPRSDMQSMLRERNSVPSLHVDPLCDDDNDDDGVVWIDPHSGITFIVDRRTGHSYPRTARRDADTAQTVDHTRRTLTVADYGDFEGEPPQWILDALEGNSAYVVRERPIPSVSQRLPNVLSLSSEHIAHATCASFSTPSVDGSLSSVLDQPSTWRFQKDDIARMKVINQLDRKFVVCAVDEIRDSDDGGQSSDSRRRILVLVDQHAASERVRVEGFLRTLCHNFLSHESNERQSADRLELNPPRAISLSRRETSILRSTQDILERWCFDLSWPELESRNQSIDQDAYEEFLVHSVPHVVSEKLLAGDELHGFLKEYAAESETDDVLPALGSECDLTWHKALRWCPKGLLSLVNSRACRGAIMFNDPLSVEQCERLMVQLSETAFPFQCAHGRPSLVPLTGTSEYSFGDGRRRKVDWEQSGSMLASVGVESSSNDVG
ncbi:hypothetical protein BC826DRAFT_980327 [Russula brevipes]|nr:hypothetical protein BC826DRAFT_980327 [Russula brevipes]